MSPDKRHEEQNPHQSEFKGESKPAHDRHGRRKKCIQHPRLRNPPQIEEGVSGFIFQPDLIAVELKPKIKRDG